MQNAAQVHIDHLVPVVQLTRLQLGVDSHSGDACQHIEAAEPLYRQVHRNAQVPVLRYLPTNLTAPEIARELHVSPNTVRTHIKNLYAKLATHHRAGAVEPSASSPPRTAPATR